MSKPIWQEQDIRWYAVAISLLLSLSSFLFPQIPNDDAYVYFRTAELFLSDGFAAANSHYGWPAYSILIALVSKLGLTLYTSALLLNTLFFMVLTWAFVSIIMMLSESKLVVVLGAVTILLYPELNEFRFLVIRDAGFWALLLIAVWQLLCYQLRPTVGRALVIAMALLCAATLRVEALIYLAVMPLITLLPSGRAQASTGKARLLLPALVFGSALAALILLAILGTNVLAMAADFLARYAPFIDNLIGSDGDQLSQQLSDSHGDLVSTESSLLNSLAVLVSTLVTAISGAFFWMLTFGAVKRYWPDRDSMPRELLVWIVINGFIALGFLILTGFLTSRYVIVLCLIVATQLPFVIAGIIENARGNANEVRIRYALILFFTFCFFDAYISFGRSRDYLVDAADYIAVHSQSGQSILTNNHAIAYASGLVSEYDAVARVPTRDTLLALPTGHYLALELIPQVETLLADSALNDGIQFVTAFPTEAEPLVAIYQRVE